MLKGGDIFKHEELFKKKKNLQGHKNIKIVGNFRNIKDYSWKEKKESSMIIRNEIPVFRAWNVNGACRIFCSPWRFQKSMSIK